MRCSNRKLLIVFEGSAQRERTIATAFFIAINEKANALPFNSGNIYTSAAASYIANNSL